MPQSLKVAAPLANNDDASTTCSDDDFDIEGYHFDIPDGDLDDNWDDSERYEPPRDVDGVHDGDPLLPCCPLAF